MAEEDKTTEAKALREQGNELYRDGDISEGKLAYLMSPHHSDNLLQHSQDTSRRVI